jgi:type III secretory pathway component EscT
LEKGGMPRKEKPKIGFSFIILFWYLGAAGVAIDSLEGRVSATIAEWLAKMAKALGLLAKLTEVLA